LPTQKPTLKKPKELLFANAETEIECKKKITLKETFSEYTLTSGQELLIDELNKFLSDNST
jgi:hypothetical protein